MLNVRPQGLRSPLMRAKEPRSQAVHEMRGFLRVTKISYKVPRKDIMFQVVIGDLFTIPGEVVVSSNSTFDTDMSNGLIAPNSLQGQLALQFFGGQTGDIDRQIAESLDGIHYRENPDRPGKHKEYPIGTIARVSAYGRNFYLLAMSHLNKNGTAHSDTKILDDALEHLWANMASRAEFGDIVIPAIGSGRGLARSGLAPEEEDRRENRTIVCGCVTRSRLLQ
jgi:hypothetical protein